MSSYDLQERLLLRETSRASAALWVPLLREVLAPTSVVELGCGVGEWLAAFERAGVRDIVGFDLPDAAEAGLAIDPSRFVGGDLRCYVPVGRRFDVAMSMEVAEHLPYDHAPAFVAYLASLADVIVFGAAVPLQGGENHTNEQFPEFWAELFALHGYQPVDCLRDIYWAEEAASWFYAQNTLLYLNSAGLDRLPHLRPFAETTDPTRLTRFHQYAPDSAVYHANFMLGLAEPQRQIEPAEFQTEQWMSDLYGYLAGRERAHRAVSTSSNCYYRGLDQLQPRPCRHPAVLAKIPPPA